MGARPVRQHYLDPEHEPVSVTIDPALAPDLTPWRTHRARFESTLRAFTNDDWLAPTRCDAWSVREVIGHLVVVDGFWAMTFANGRDGQDPTTFLRGFDPSSSTDDLVAATLPLSIDELLERFSAGATALAHVLDSLTPEQWHARTESPLGHLPMLCSAGHMFWDSWLHERDILAPRQHAPVEAAPVPADELLAVTWFSFCFAGLQGGTLDDPNPVGAGPEAPIDATVTFDDLPDVALRVRFDTAIEISRSSVPTDAITSGSAAEFVDAFGGRAPLEPVLERFPADLAAQLTRAAQVL